MSATHVLFVPLLREWRRFFQVETGGVLPTFESRNNKYIMECGLENLDNYTIRGILQYCDGIDTLNLRMVSRHMRQAIDCISPADFVARTVARDSERDMKVFMARYADICARLPPFTMEGIAACAGRRNARIARVIAAHSVHLEQYVNLGHDYSKGISSAAAYVRRDIEARITEFANFADVEFLTIIMGISYLRREYKDLFEIIGTRDIAACQMLYKLTGSADLILYYAARGRNLPNIEYALSVGANRHKLLTGLMAGGHLDLAEAEITSGRAHFEAYDVFPAVEGGTEIFQWYISVAGIEPARIICAAARHGRYDIFQQYYSPIEYGSEILWICAGYGGNTDICQFLLDADPHPESSLMRQMGDYAVAMGHKNIIRLLIAKDVMMLTPIATNCVCRRLHALCRWLLECWPALIECMINVSATEDIVDVCEMLLQMAGSREAAQTRAEHMFMCAPTDAIFLLACQYGTGQPRTTVGVVVAHPRISMATVISAYKASPYDTRSVVRKFLEQGEMDADRTELFSCIAAGTELPEWARDI